MKKYFGVLGAILLVCIIGFFLYKPSVNHPYEIVKGKSKLSYYDTEDNIKIKDFNVLEKSVKNYLNVKDNNVLINQEGIIRFINVSDKDVITYKKISVGDDINKIKKTFNYECEMGDIYYVYFNGDTEEDPKNDKPEDSWVCIFYLTDGSKITGIQISDFKFRNKLL